MRRRHADAGAAPAAPSAGEARHAHVIALAAVALALLAAGCGNNATPAERSPPTPTEPAGHQTGDGVFGRFRRSSLASRRPWSPCSSTRVGRGAKEAG